ncbi:MAG: hypothetical protein PHQ59_05780 [Candidatus Daviesbacteria bacterium]|nr:hypothetical protein [Candidatus Daviesbacteria bacterium]
MPKLLIKSVLIFLSLLVVVTANIPLCFAQLGSVDFTYTYNVPDKEITDGDIISSSAEKGFFRSDFAYDSHAFGVVQLSPLIVYKGVDSTGTPIARTGTATVNVTTLNGPIIPGDFVTTSEIAGKGQKAVVSGNVIGVALTGLGLADGTEFDYQRKSTTNQQNPSQKFRTGKVTVALRMEYAEITSARTALRLLDSFNAALFTNVQNPDQFVKIFRYITAIIIVLISFAIGFFTFSRAIPKGIEAIGRNPLAQKTIIFSIVLNIAFTVITAVAGIAAAIMILKF